MDGFSGVRDGRKKDSRWSERSKAREEEGEAVRRLSDHSSV